MSGVESIQNSLGEGVLERLEQTHQKYRAKKMEAAARLGESLEPNQLEAEQVPTFGPHNATSALAKSPRKAKSRKQTSPSTEQQFDFFVPTLCDVAAKDNRNLMDVALFRLSKRDKRAGEVIRYDLPDGFVEVKAGPDGMASIWDYDIVLMLISHLTESMNLFNTGRAAMPSKQFVPHASDIAKFCRRGDGGRQADELEAALDRLVGTTIKSVREIPSRNGKRLVRETEAESLIGPYRVVSRTDTGKVARVEIEAPNWIYREVTSGERPDVLTVHPDYFLIEPGLGRFLYRLARRAAGKSNAKWSFKTVYERSGSTGTFKEFCRLIRRLIESNDLPEYDLSEEAGQSGPQLLIQHRSNSMELIEKPELSSENDDVIGV